MDIDKFKYFRNKLDLTQSEMANLLGVTLRAVQYWESGQRKIPNIVGILISYIAKEKQIKI